MGSSTFYTLHYLKALPSAVLLNSITHECPGLLGGTERVTRGCTRLYMGQEWAWVPCFKGLWLLDISAAFSLPPAPPFCNSLLKETSLGCAELSTAAICRDTTRSSSTSQFTGWTVVGNAHSLHWQIASAPKVLPTEQTRVVSLLPLHPCVYVGEAIQPVTFWGRDHVQCFFIQHLVQCCDECQHLFVSVIGHFTSKRIVYASFTEF